MSLTLSPHVLQKAPGTRFDRIVKVIPYIRICSKEGPPIFLQRGKAYSEGGGEIKKSDYPDWFYDQLKTLSPNALQECGWEAKKPEEKQVEAKVIETKPVKRKAGRPKGSKTRKKVTRKAESARPELSESDGDSSAGRNVGSEGSI
jgi:hypothetical protein